MSGDDRRFLEVYELFYRRVYAYCRRRTTADLVDDAVADVFLTVWRRIADVPEGDQTLPWLFGIAYRVLGHQWRSSARRRRLSQKLTSLGVNPALEPDDILVVRAESMQIRDALQALPTIDQEILRLVAWEDLSHDQISTILGINVGAVRQRFYKARKSLTREYNRRERKTHRFSAAQEGGMR